MSTEELDEEFELLLTEILSQKDYLNDYEQNLIDAWISALRSLDNDDKLVRNDYLKYLRSQLDREEKHLSKPFLQQPPETRLPPLKELLDASRLPEKALRAPGVEYRRYQCSSPEQKPPCRPRSIPAKSPERTKKSEENDFENSEEMAKCIAKSKGMTLAEFVVDISRHTADKGHELRKAMNTEITAFKEHVERIMTQRMKDLGELLDDRQSKELLKIQKDYDEWLSELSFCKTELKAIVPDFDIDAYRKDGNYLKKFFSVSTSSPPAEDKLKEWKEENCLRLLWFMNEITKLTDENNQVIEQISSIKAKTYELEQKESRKEQCRIKYIRSENVKCKKLKQKNDRLNREIADLLISLEN